MIRHTPRKQCPEISYLELRVVLSLAGAQVIGYYTLFAGAISCDAAAKSMRRNTPDPLLVLLLGRLAIDRRYHNQSVGNAQLPDTMMRSAHIHQAMTLLMTLDFVPALLAEPH